MKRYFTLFLVLAALGLGATAAGADDLGDGIARTLCFSEAASITLSDADSARYDGTELITGQYIKLKGTVTEHAKFNKSANSAVCEKSTCTASQSNCPKAAWNIAKDGNILKKASGPTGSLLVQ